MRVTIWRVRVRVMWVTIWYVTMHEKEAPGVLLGRSHLLINTYSRGEGEGAYWKDDGESKFYGKPRAVRPF